MVHKLFADVLTWMAMNRVPIDLSSLSLPCALLKVGMALAVDWHSGRIALLKTARLTGAPDASLAFLACRFTASMKASQPARLSGSSLLTNKAALRGKPVSSLANPSLPLSIHSP
jgi:hypothetical protein